MNSQRSSKDEVIQTILLRSAQVDCLISQLQVNNIVFGCLEVGNEKVVVMSKAQGHCVKLVYLLLFRYHPVALFHVFRIEE